MVLTKKQKVMVAVLSLGVAALVVDKAFLGEEAAGPSRTQAATPPGPAPTAPPAATATPPEANDRLVAKITSLAATLDAVRDALDLDLSGTRDAFCPSKNWLSDIRPNEAMATTSQEVRAIEFTRRHELKAVVTRGEGGAAFIDDTHVRVGQIIDGFTLVSVRVGAANLAAGELQVELKLKTDSPQR